MHVQCAVPRIAYASHQDSFCLSLAMANTDRLIPESHLHAVTDDADRLAVSPSLLHLPRVVRVLFSLVYVTQRLRPHVPTGLDSGNGDEA
jgi:hypothetical protein